MSPHRQALAIQLSRNFDEVCIWAREEATVAAINDGENTIYFPGFRLPESIKATTNKDAAVSGSDKNETILVLIVVPTPALEEVVSDLRLDDRHILVSCTKGILNDTLETPDAILTRVTGGFQRVAFLSGPSFAKEVAENQPTVGVDPLTWTDVPARPDARAHSLFCSQGVTIASRDDAIARTVQSAISTERFRCYTTDDVVGVELGGALKNVLAIATGVSDGLGFGNNARALLMTRGLAEIGLIATTAGANPLTLSGLAGVGDLILTCTSTLSRNYTVGWRLGKGEALDVITSSLGAVAEGVLTSRSAHMLAVKLGVECPVIAGIHKVIHENGDPLLVLRENMTRPLKEELLF